jgi:FAD/FMN-containing dehydrogenase/Fe-S oxidoreductase
VGRSADTADAEGLEADLRRSLDGEVRFDRGVRAIYSTDSSNYRQLPIGVVIPRTIDDVVAAVAVCREHAVPVLSRGGGTSLAGQCCNTAVVIDFSKYLNRVLEIDRDRRLARVQPGCILDELRDVAEDGTPRLTFGPDPSTHDHCTLGGMIGNNSCGTHSVLSEFFGRGPRMEHNVADLEVLTFQGLRLTAGPTSDQDLDRIVAGGGGRGEIYARLRDLRDRHAAEIRTRYPDFPRRISGYNLDELLPERGFNVAGSLVGSESTCVTVLQATLHLVDSPPARSVVIAGFGDVYAAAAAVAGVREHSPIGLEGFDDVLVENNRKLGIHRDALEVLPDGAGWLLVEFGGETSTESDGKAERLIRKLRKEPGFREAALVDDPEVAEKIWEVRESGLGATAFVPGEPDTHEGWEDSAVPPERLDGYLRDLRALYGRYGYHGAFYGHFGQGCVHTRIDWDQRTEEGRRKWREFVEEAADLVLSYGGSLSGEHGDGQSRAELLPKMFGRDLVRAFGEFKSTWDPDAKMNPGKIVDPFPILSHLREGQDYQPKPVKVHFAYPEDGGSFGHATVRCVGIGTCRRMDGGTMCPSFMVTREEQHTTRGRARILFEMMNGAGEIDLWKSEEVFQALELCLSCKGCKRDCPVGVDMATYKAEFLSHYYRGRPRPRAAYALGLIPWWARAASVAPALANFVTNAPGLSGLVKRAGGIALERRAPTFARRSFRAEFGRRGSRVDRARPPVLLWTDTFTNYFHPEVARAHVELLEAAGHRVQVPDRVLCCGRPLYDYGMLDTARRWLRRILDELRPHIRAGTPVIGMEPSCAAVFRDELPNLFPRDEYARRLSKQTFALTEHLERRGWRPPAMTGRPALVQRHCHRQAVMGFDSDERMLGSLGLDYEILEAGCCGMAGSFGFEAGQKYRVSQRAAERVLLPRVREASAETLIIADGFSCRVQIEQGTGRKAVHLAEVMLEALRERRSAAGPKAGNRLERGGTENGRTGDPHG